ncbi:MAG: methyltransferase domain-containing protein, partial [Acidimicrobiales bacterium]|nr:methyltransferase domain-containing protein [Acidimicrobiales bacterium]
MTTAPTTPSKRLTGERPVEGVTPDSLLALHAAGYRTVIERLGAGLTLDVGCGQGFESARLLGETRPVVGVDYSADAVGAATVNFGSKGLRVGQMDAT